MSVRVINPAERPEFASALPLRGADSESQSLEMHVIHSFHGINFELKDDAYKKSLREHAANDGLNLHTGQELLSSHEKRTNDGLALYDLF